MALCPRGTPNDEGTNDANKSEEGQEYRDPCPDRASEADRVGHLCNLALIQRLKTALHLRMNDVLCFGKVPAYKLTNSTCGIAAEDPAS